MRTAVAYQLEPERYDVKVTIKPREGSRNVSHQLGLSGFGEPWVFEQRSFDASPDAQSATFRLPPGTYSTGAISFGLAHDGANEGVVTYNPTFSVSKNTEIVLDENTARRFDYKVDKPVVDDGAILDVGWNGDAGYTGFTFYGARGPRLRAAVEGPDRRIRDGGRQLAAQPARGAHQSLRAVRRCRCGRSRPPAAASPRHRWPPWTAPSGSSTPAARRSP